MTIKRALIGGISILSLITASVAAFAAPPPAWVDYYNCGSGTSASALASVSDSAGNAYVTGWVGKPFLGISADTIKYNANGTVAWTATVPGGQPTVDENFGKAIALDSGGNVYVAMDSKDHVPGSGFNPDIKVVKYNSSGTQQWITTYDGPSSPQDFVFGIAVDSSGNSYVTGFSGVLGNPASSTQVLLKYNTSGVLQWTSTFAGAQGTRVRLDTSGNVYVGGTSGIRKYDSAGTFLWATTGILNVTSLSIDPSGNPIALGGASTSDTVYKVSASTGSLTWSESGLVCMTLDSSGNAYTLVQNSSGIGACKYRASDGSMIWINYYTNTGGTFSLTGPDSYELANRYHLIDVDSVNKCVYIQGQFVPTGSSYTSIAVAKFDFAAGTLLWSDLQAGPGTGAFDGQAVIDHHGGVFSVGSAWIPNPGPTTGDIYMTMKYTN